MISKIIFWTSVSLIFYTYAGYPLLIWSIALIKRMVSKRVSASQSELPEVTLLIAAYNEKEHLEMKVRNSLSLDYPKEKLKIVFVTDGSDDGSDEYLNQYKEVTVYHQSGRQGKTAAINRVIPFVKSPVVILCDANTILNQDAVQNLVRPFADPRVGCVAGEKRVSRHKQDSAPGTGESIYWNYESLIKQAESDVHTVIGAAGELYAMRTALFEPLEQDVILDDFVVSMQVIIKGSLVKYSHNAYSSELASASISNELKRKIRIAAGSFQTLFRSPALLNPFRFGFVSLQYFSHKVLRWTLVPFAFLFAFVCNGIIVAEPMLQGDDLFAVLFILQILFYVFVGVGYLFRNKKSSIRIIYLPYYLIMMNTAMVLGLVRYLRGKQPVTWEKAR